jgi:NAD-dependent SIR2 family protein deacetylase
MNAAAQEFIKNIAQEIEARSCTFLLGAGVSIEAGMPSGSELAEMLARKAGWEYAGQPLQQIAFQRLYDNFRRCEHDDLTYVQDQVLPSIAATYHLDAFHLRGFFEDTLELALRIAK